MLLVQVAGYALLVPFFGWGIYLLRRRYLYYEESTSTVEIATTVFVGVFFWVESLVLREALSGQIIPFLAAVLGLSMAGFALYAHVVISLLSRLVVDMVAPSNDTAIHQPRFGPVDSLEEDGDFEAALDEYLVLARIYPRNVEVLSRTANAQKILGRPKEAAEWYLRARKRAKRADDALEVVNQLCNLYDQELNAPELVDAQLAGFIRDFPDSLDLDIVRDRLNRRLNRTDWSVSDFLELLSDEPIAASSDSDLQTSSPDPGHLVLAKVPVELVSLETDGAAEKAPQKPEDPVPERPSSVVPITGPGIAPLSSEPLADQKPLKKKATSTAARKKTAATPAKKAGSMLEALEDVAPAQETENTTPTPKRSTISLDPMDDDSA